MLKAIKVEGVSKQYRLGQIGTGSLKDDMNRWWHQVRGKEDPYLKIGEANDRSTKGSSEYVWSLRDVSFDIEQGDSVGIIGRNGAGKSTLLKILSRVTAPTTGSLKVKGRIASLLEVGTGFHPDLSGRDNIYLNGAILGMRKHEIKRKFDEIVDFAGVERYIDTPVKRYSSGMYVRLAFAVAAYLESEILIVDEVLAVGDAEFQKKCLGKMGQVSKGEGRTVLFVSHNMSSITQLCSKGILLSNGTMEYSGDAIESVKKYSNQTGTKSNKWNATSVKATPYVQEIDLSLKGKQPELKLEIAMAIGGMLDFSPAFVAFDIKNGFGTTIMQAIPSIEPFINNDSIDKRLNFEISLTGLIPDRYSISVWLGPHNTETYDYQDEILSFEVLTTPTEGRTFPHSLERGFIVPNSKIVYDSF
jgi:lipopolysaccharide transport system ATP-binding protein